MTPRHRRTGCVREGLENSILEQRTKQVAPESHAIVHKHIDAFWKGKAAKVKGAGLAGVIPLVLG